MLWAMVFITATEQKKDFVGVAKAGTSRACSVDSVFHLYLAYRWPIWQSQRTPSQAVAILSRN